MRHTLFAILLSILFSCHSNNDIVIEFPKGGYPYPTTIDKKSENFPSYPLKDLLKGDDSFRIAYYGDLFLKALDEPNLSIKKQATIVFRFTYEAPMRQPLVVNFTENEIIIKEGIKG